MRQFDLVENPSVHSRAHAPYFLILQSHYLGLLDTIVVAPVVRDARRAISNLDLHIQVGGEPLVLSVGELFSIERSLLKATKGSLSDHEDAIRRALDRVFTGF